MKDDSAGDDLLDDEEPGYTRWPRVYAAVLAVTALVIALLYLFYRHYAG